MSWTNVGSDGDPGWQNDESTSDPGWADASGGADASWTDGTSSSAQTWTAGEDGTASLWNRPRPFRDDGDGVDFISVLGGGWVIGPARNSIRLLDRDQVQDRNP